MTARSGVRERLGQWDTQLACLSEQQKDCFIELSSAAAYRPIPGHLLVEDGASNSCPESLSIQLDHIQNSQQFMAWCAEVEMQAESEQDKCYREYSRQLCEYRDQCQEMLGEADRALSTLHAMKERHEFVSQRTGALHNACEQLMQDQTRLVNIAETISAKLAYFTELDHIGARLSSPAFSVTSEALLPLLTRLDECISFTENNRHYKEAQLYAIRFKQYLQRSLALVKQHVVNTFHTTTTSILPKPGVVPVLSENSYAQYYGKFRSNAPKIKALMKQIELRAENAPEYRTLLHDCYKSYVSQRGLLLTPLVHSSLEQINKQYSSDATGLIRSGCDFLCRVCQDEYLLYFHFFSVDSPELKGLLESLCYTLYDVLRPIVIHVNHLETLADLCGIFKVEMLEEIVAQKGMELAVFGTIVRQLLGDAQQRIVFRAQRYIQTDIRGYSPAPGDLAYPDKLLVAAQVSVVEASLDGTPDTTDSDSVFEASGTETDTGSRAGSGRSGRKKRNKKFMAAADMHDMWYPTVRRTLLCLSKLYRCIDKSIFEGIAQEALSECVKSLCSASTAIRSTKPSLDAQLFLIKHLLILREQIAAFDVAFSVTELSLDWSKTTSAVYELLKKKSRLFSFGSNNAFLEFFLEGVPGIMQTQMDSKKEVDVQLKTVCEKFIAETSTSLTAPLKDFLTKCNVIFQLAEKDRLDPANILHQQPFAKADEIHKVVAQGNKILKLKVPALRSSLTVYLANEETEHILFRPIKANVLQTYEALERITVHYYSTTDQFIISAPTQDQVSLMLAVTQESHRD